MAELPEEQCFELRSQSHDRGVSGSAKRMKTNGANNGTSKLMARSSATNAKLPLPWSYLRNNCQFRLSMRIQLICVGTQPFRPKFLFWAAERTLRQKMSKRKPSSQGSPGEDWPPISGVCYTLPLHAIRPYDRLRWFVLAHTASPPYCLQPRVFMIPWPDAQGTLPITVKCRQCTVIIRSLKTARLTRSHLLSSLIRQV